MRRKCLALCIHRLSAVFVFLLIIVLVVAAGCTTTAATGTYSSAVILERVAGKYESEYRSGVKPVLELRDNRTYALTINHCEYMHTSEGAFFISGSEIVLKDALSGLFHDVPRPSNDIIVTVIDNNTLEIKSGAVILYRGTQYGFCAPTDGERFYRK